MTKTRTGNPPPLNPHCFRKMKQAETNFMRHFWFGKDRRRAKKWARQYRKWLDKLITC